MVTTPLSKTFRTNKGVETCPHDFRYFLYVMGLVGHECGDLRFGALGS